MPIQCHCDGGAWANVSHGYYAAPAVSDNCPGATASCSPPSGSSFPLGTTTVNCTATDTSNNQASCNFTVTVSGSLLVNADSFLRDGADNTNEGANNLLRIQSSGHNRVVVRFNLSGISTAGLQSATLVLNITDNSDNWGSTGRLVDANRLLADWTEGNGHTVGDQPNYRRTGEGVTWNCAKDSNIANQNDDCVSQWNGGTFAAATASPVLHTNGQLGDVSWNVTADVLAGASNGWVIKKQNEGQAGQVKYYSKEYDRIERLCEQERELIKSGKAMPIGAPTTPILYVAMDATSVPVVPREVEGRRGKGEDGKAKSREAKLGCVFPQTDVDEKGRPVRDADSTTYVGAIETASEFGWRIYAEALRRGLARALRVVVLGDGAPWIWTLAALHREGPKLDHLASMLPDEWPLGGILGG